AGCIRAAGSRRPTGRRDRRRPPGPSHGIGGDVDQRPATQSDEARQPDEPRIGGRDRRRGPTPADRSPGCFGPTVGARRARAGPTERGRPRRDGVPGGERSPGRHAADGPSAGASPRPGHAARLATELALAGGPPVRQDLPRDRRPCRPGL
ncbi:MAG: hypothetical protein AVDCRST_MAG49-3928, partial [uncultured Thermomicrobiales bacterium]